MKFRSLLTSSIRGSIGGLTYTRGSSHALQGRKRTSPVDSPVNSAVQARTAFGTASKLWSLLTDDERGAWIHYAASVSDVLTPINVVQNARSLAIGQFVLSSVPRPGAPPWVAGDPSMLAPDLPGRPAIDLTQIQKRVLPPKHVRFILRNNEAVNLSWLIKFSDPVNMGKSVDPGRYNSVHNITGAATVGNSTVLQFDDFISGRKYFYSITAIDQRAGRRYSKPLKGTVIVP